MINRFLYKRFKSVSKI